MQLTGILLISTSLALFLIERLSQSFSRLLGKVICGESYMQPANGVIGDASCGFNMDMYMTVGLSAAAVTGVILVIASALKS